MSVLVAEPPHHSSTGLGPGPRHLSPVSLECHVSGLLLLPLECFRRPHRLSSLRLRIALGPLYHLLFLTSPGLCLPRAPLEQGHRAFPLGQWQSPRPLLVTTMACSPAMGRPTLRVGNHSPLPGPSSLLRWLPCSQQRSGGVPPPPPPLAPPPPRRRPHPRPRPRPAPVLAIRRALVFLLSPRWR